MQPIKISREVIRQESKLHAATTIRPDQKVELKGRIYNRSLHDNTEPPAEWAKDPNKRKVIFKNMEESNIAPWLTNAQMRQDNGEQNILITARVSERTYGQRALWKAIIAERDIRNSRNKDADNGVEVMHDNAHDRRLRQKWIDLGNNICPVFAQMSADHAEVFRQISDVMYDNHLMQIMYADDYLNIIIFDKDDKTPLLTFENLLIRSMKR